MIVSIMQPYFFPYIGYFQLLAASDVFVFYDDVQYIKNGWVNRNRILINGAPNWFTLPVRKDHHHLPINRRVFNRSNGEQENLLRRVEVAYKRAPYFESVYALVKELFAFPDPNVAAFNINSVRRIAAHIGLTTRTVLSSDLDLDSTLKGQDRVLAVCAALGARRYINASGGHDLYRARAFESRGIDLRFLHPGNTAYRQIGGENIENLSIIDALMFNEAGALKELLSRYELTTNEQSEPSIAEVRSEKRREVSFYSESEVQEIGFKRVGKGAKISSKASFHNPQEIEIGDYTRIDDFCVLSASSAGISIGRNVHIAVFSSLIGGARIEMHDFSGLSSHVSVYSSSDDYSGAVMTNPTVPADFTHTPTAPVIIGRHVIIGAGTVVLPGVTLHEGSGVGALSLVKRDCEAFGMYFGIPAKRIGSRSKAMLEQEQQLLASERAPKD